MLLFTELSTSEERRNACYLVQVQRFTEDFARMMKRFQIRDPNLVNLGFGQRSIWQTGNFPRNAPWTWGVV